MCLTDCELQNDYLYVLIPMKSYVKIHVKRKLVYVVASNKDEVQPAQLIGAIGSQWLFSLQISFSGGQQN